MLDLIISYINFVILSLRYIVKWLTFQPPTPPGYIISKDRNSSEEDIFFLREIKPVIKYIPIDFKFIHYYYDYINNDKNQKIPVLVFKPFNPLPICIIYCHGNSVDIGLSLLETYDIAMNTNCIVINFEYPGYGICEKFQLSEYQSYIHLQKTYKYVVENLEISPDRIIVYGFSLGTGFAFDLACTEGFPISGLILQSPFLSILRIFYNVKGDYYYDIFKSYIKAKNLKAKTFFIHGDKDSIVPYIHGRILASIIPEQYLYDFFTVQGADHNDLFKRRENNDKFKIYKKIRKFIEYCTGIDYNTYQNENNINNSPLNNIIGPFIKNEKIEESSNKSDVVNNIHSSNNSKDEHYPYPHLKLNNPKMDNDKNINNVYSNMIISNDKKVDNNIPKEMMENESENNGVNILPQKKGNKESKENENSEKNNDSGYKFLFKGDNFDKNEIECLRTIKPKNINIKDTFEKKENVLALKIKKTPNNKKDQKQKNIYLDTYSDMNNNKKYE